MVSKIRSLGVKGIGGYEVSVECFISNGLPGFDVVGLPDAAVRESRERVRAAIKNNGLKFPVSRMTVNLAPADTKKAGTVYDLPVLLGILAASGDIKQPEPDCAFFGELSLTGDVREVPGALPMALAAPGAGIRRLFRALRQRRGGRLCRERDCVPCKDRGPAAGILPGRGGHRTRRARRNIQPPCPEAWILRRSRARRT
jgi:predicted ATPase with chaperone activity